MAVTKLKAYHSDSAVQNAVGYVLNADKTQLQDTSRFMDAKGMEVIENAMHYAENQLKTTYVAEDGKTEVLVSGHRCKVDLAKDTFQRCADTYYRNGHSEHAGKKYRVKTLLRAKLGSDGKPVLDSNGKMIHDEKSPVYHDENGDTVTFLQERTTQVRTCYMWVMSFPPKRVCGYEIDPHLVHQIGKEFMEELEQAVGLEYAAVIATHIDKEHTHNHIVQCSYALDGHHKYVDTMETLKLARDISDRLSQKYDLPIIFSPDNAKSITHEEWKLIQQGKSWKQTIREEIAYNLERSSGYEDFLRKMYQSGYKVRETEKSLTYYTPKKDHRCRDVGLGKEYTKAAILEYFQELPLEQQVQKEVADVIDPSQITTSAVPLRLYVNRYTNSGRRRSDLELLLLMAIKIIQYLKDKFSDTNESNNPIRKSASWKVARLSEAIEILNTLGIQTKSELAEQLNRVGAEYSHFKKDYHDISQSRDGLEYLADLLENFSDLQNLMNDLGISDAYLAPATASEVAEKRATLFPMTSSQRRELYLALQKKPLYRINSKFTNMTYDEAKECIRFLNGHSDTMPEQLTTVLEFKENLDKKYASIAEKTLQGMREKLQGKVITERFQKFLDSLQLGIDVNGISLCEGIHLAAYYKPWKPSFLPCKDNTLLVSSSKAKQVKELLHHLGKEINIPVEQLSKTDADTLFQDLLLSTIPPASIKNTLDAQFEASLSGLDYETRGYAHEWRNACRTITGLGYDTAKVDEVLAQVRAQLDNIHTAEHKLKKKAQEYRTLKQLDAYVTLSADKRFTHGPKWQEAFKDVDIALVNSHLQTHSQHNISEHDIIRTRTNFSQDISIDF